MIHSTQGIVLHSFRYGESSIIARILSPNLGLQSYLVQSVYKSKSKTKASLFQPLTLVDMVVYIKEHKPGLRRIKEIRCTMPLNTIYTDIRKISLAIFISEILVNVCSRQEIGESLYSFIQDSIVSLDRLQDNLNSFHIIFLLELSALLGFGPGKNFSEKQSFFNLREGVYQNGFEDSAYSLNQEESRAFYQASKLSISKEESALMLTAQSRKVLLQKTIDYYRIHLEGFREIKSHKILELVLN